MRPKMSLNKWNGKNNKEQTNKNENGESNKKYRIKKPKEMVIITKYYQEHLKKIYIKE